MTWGGPAEGVVVGPCVDGVARVDRHEFGERKGVYVYLVAAAAELGGDVGRKKARVAAGDIHVGVVDF